MDNTYKIEEDIDSFLNNTKAKRFFLRLLAPSGDKVWTVGGWAKSQASEQDWEPDAEVLNRSNLKDRYYEILREHTRTYPTFADAIELKIIKEKDEE